MTERETYAPSQRLVDEVSGRRVLVPAPDRRPPIEKFRGEDIKPRPHNPNCPFCVGNEGSTEPELSRVGSGEPNTPGWEVRVFPNQKPVFDGPGHVIAITNDDWRSYGFLTKKEAEKVLRAAQRTVQEHLKGPNRFLRTYVLCNNRTPSGASIPHPHWQVNSTNEPTKSLQNETDLARSRGEAALAQSMGFALREGLAISVVENNGQPIAIGWAEHIGGTLRFRVAPVSPSRSFAEASGREVSAVAKALQDLLARIYAYFGNLPYNFVLENGIAADPDAEVNRGWSVELWCREMVRDPEGGRSNVAHGTAVHEGFEVQQTNPFEVAAALRAVEPVPGRVWKDLHRHLFGPVQDSSIGR